MTMLPDVEANTEPLWEGCALKLDFKNTMLKKRRKRKTKQNTVKKL